MSNNSKKFIEDILDSILPIETFTASINSFATFSNDRLVRRATERELEIISEALSRILELEPNLNISDSKLIKGLRNRIIHAYDSVDDAIVWNAVKKHLPILKAEIEALLK